MPSVVEPVSQFYVRLVGFVHQFRALTHKEMQPIVERLWKRTCHMPYDPANVEESAACAALLRMTRGNLRLIDRLFKQVRRVMKVNHLSHIDERVVQTARESLIVGIS